MMSNVTIWVLTFWSGHLTGRADFFEKAQCDAMLQAIQPMYQGVCLPEGRDIGIHDTERDWDWFAAMYGGRVLSLKRGVPVPSVIIQEVPK